MYLVFSTSLSPTSRSRILANRAASDLTDAGHDVELIDLAEIPLPFCDADTCYGDPQVAKIAEAIASAKGILLAGPIYNYDFSSSAKNLVELTGKAWTDKVVGFLCAAGGQGSYMSPMSLANSLMLDFRCLVLPRFVFATDDKFDGSKISDPQTFTRVNELALQLVRVSNSYLSN